MTDFYALRPSSMEKQLLDYIQRLADTRTGRRAVYIHLSNLSLAYNRPLYLRIAAQAFSQSLSGLEGRIFTFANGDILFLAKNATPTLLEAAVAKVRLLFSQDPLLEAADEQGAPAFHTLYDLETDFAKLLALAQRLNTEAETKKSADLFSTTPYAAPPTPIAPEMLVKLERTLETVDVSNISRRQMVCTLLDGRPPQPLFDEIFVSINDLRDIITPGVDLVSDTWLFRYLTHKLDERVMYMLMRDGAQTTHPFSVNLNVASILTPAFQKFEQTIAPQLKGRLVIELNKLDVFSDMGAFLFVRDYLHDHGFRLCLDGLTHHTLPYYDRQKLGFDLVKIYWTPLGLDTMLPSQKAEVRGFIMNTGQAHTILCRCDNARAIETGQDLGIIMFQGRHVDRLRAGR